MKSEHKIYAGANTIVYFDEKGSDITCVPANIIRKAGETEIYKTILDMFGNDERNLQESVLSEEKMLEGKKAFIEYLNSAGYNEELAKTAKAYRPLETDSDPALDKALFAAAIVSGSLKLKVNILTPVIQDRIEQMKSVYNDKTKKEIMKDINDINEEIDRAASKNSAVMSYIAQLLNCYSNPNRNS